MPLHGLPLTDFYQGRTLNFAHRGARTVAPENTLAAFRLAADQGADGVELDVQLSADGQIVVIHNDTVDATTDGTGPVAQMPLAALRELDAGSYFSPEFAGERIPTLDEVFEEFGHRLLLNVELKALSVTGNSARRLAAAVVDAIRRHGLASRVLLSSFNPLALRAVKRIDRSLPVGYLYAPDLRHEARHPHHSMVDAPYMQWARRRAYRVNVWTVNDVEDIRRMRDLGVDMIISDRPDLVQDVLQGER